MPPGMRSSILSPPSNADILALQQALARLSQTNPLARFFPTIDEMQPGVPPLLPPALPSGPGGLPGLPLGGRWTLTGGFSTPLGTSGINVGVSYGAPFDTIAAP